MIQFIRYADDPVINAAAQRHVNCMTPNPFDWRREHADKTIKAIRKNLRRAFGAEAARRVRISVH
jgi:hypothetical protein